MRIADFFAEHLKPATNADDLCSILDLLVDPGLKTLRSKPVHVVDRILGARQKDDVKMIRHRLRKIDGVRQKPEIREVRDMWKAQDGHIRSAGHRNNTSLHADTVFGIQIDVLCEWKHSQTGTLRPLFQNTNTVFKKPKVAAETIDEKRSDKHRFVGLQEMERADDGRKNAAAIDIRHEDCRGLQPHGQTQVHQIAMLQVQLGDAARSLDHDEIVVRSESRIAASTCSNRKSKCS